MSVLTWVVFITRLVSPHRALRMLNIKVSFLLRKDHFSKNCCWQELPTALLCWSCLSVHHAVEPFLSFPSKGSCCIPTSLQRALPIDTVSQSCHSFPSIQVLSYKNKHISVSLDQKVSLHHSFLFHGEEYYVYSSSVTFFLLKSVLPTSWQYFMARLPLVRLLLFSLTTNTMTCPRAVTQPTTESGYWSQRPSLPDLLDPKGAHWTTLP